MNNNEFMSWLKGEYTKTFKNKDIKDAYVNELIYILRMGEKDCCVSLFGECVGNVCIPSAKETFIPTRYLEKSIEYIEYDTEDPEWPCVDVKVCERKEI
jgi:hypothetical protein